MGDVFFSLGALVLLIYFFDKANELAFRFYMLWGSVLGLLIYLRLLSLAVMRILFKFYKLVHFVLKGIEYLLNLPYRGLILVMRPPYAILRWAGLLFYRLSEVLLSSSFCRARDGIMKGWKRLFPPRGNV